MATTTMPYEHLVRALARTTSTSAERSRRAMGAASWPTRASSRGGAPGSHDYWEPRSCRGRSCAALELGLVGEEIEGTVPAIAM